MNIDAPVNGLDHEPGQVRREGFFQSEDPFEQCPPGLCGVCSNQHILVWKDKRIAEYYGDADQILKENGYPIW
jgi:hypothetical protein